MIQIESSALVVTVLPEVGGKIGQIRVRNTDQDLLIAPRRPYCTIPMDGDWLQHDTSGMDDCFPNVARGSYPQEPWATTYLPDLGEWTHGVWDIAETNANGVVMQRRGGVLPYFATKDVHFVDEGALEFTYKVENRGTAPIRYLWSAHPLISVAGEFKLQLPPGDFSFRTFPPDGEVRLWPNYKSIDLSSQWIPHGSNLKVFITGLSEGWCALHWAGQVVRFIFDLASVPVLGVWFNNHGFPSGDENAFRCIAVEPCTSPSDLLDDLASAAYPVLPAGGSAQWWLRLTVTQS